MRNKWSEHGMCSGDQVKVFGAWEDITWCGENPQTVCIDLEHLKEAVEILERMNINYAYLTVSNDDQPLILSEQRYKGGIIAIAPRVKV